MLFVVIAYFAHVTENMLIAYIIKDTGPYLYIPLSYILSTIWVFSYERGLRFKTGKKNPDWNLIFSHKGPLVSYIGGAFIGNALWFFSLYLIGIGTVSFILVFIRLFVAIYAYLFMGDRYPADKIVAFATAFVALIFYSYNGLEENFLGIALALVSCLGFSAETIGKKKLALSGLRPESLVFWRYFTLAILFCLSFLVFQTLQLIPSDMLETPSPFTFLLIFFACFLGSVGTNIVLFYGLKTIPLSTLEALNTTKPVLFSILGILMLNETITSHQILWGMVIVLSSLYFVLPGFGKVRQKLKK